MIDPIRNFRRAFSVLSVAAVLFGNVPSARAEQAHREPHGDAAPAATPRGKHDATVRHSFDDVQHWVAMFDDPARDQWQKPAELVRALGIGAGMRVADLGAGTGYFSRYLSAAVGESGTVFAVDPEPNLVAHLRERAEREGTANVVPVLASRENPRLPAAGIDLVLVVDTFHHIDDRPGYFRRLAGCLKPGGRVAIVDFKKEDLPVGPPLDHKLTRDQIVEEMQAAGYRLVAEPGLLPYQYALIFGVPARAGDEPSKKTD
ncbi:MAG: methyltransferase domain-containing protein [Deltaproteobacteria bacterium]|nr:methyltransferase domain-containing protein [Deltaproteobacteria bacterium]